jgi:hypothetical protein
MVHKLGYGNWEELKSAFRMSPLFRFDWFVKSRTTQELSRRCDTLIRLVEKENQECDERDRQARKDKKVGYCSPITYQLPALTPLNITGIITFHQDEPLSCNFR